MTGLSADRIGRFVVIRSDGQAMWLTDRQWSALVELAERMQSSPLEAFDGPGDLDAYVDIGDQGE